MGYIDQKQGIYWGKTIGYFKDVFGENYGIY